MCPPLAQSRAAPAAAERAAGHAAAVHAGDAYVDAGGLAYMTDFTGAGLYIVEFTGFSQH
jgi:hypothetical protein